MNPQNMIFIGNFLANCQYFCSTKKMKAIVLGSTGAVGQALVRELVANSKYDEVRAITRREFAFEHQSPRFNQKTINFDSLESHGADLQGYDAVFVAMGTTRANAGGAAQFVKIDQDLTIDTTKATLTKGMSQHILYVSSAGASSSSPFLYPKSKGQTESRLKSLGASSVSIFRPGYLEVENSRPTTRLAESIAGPLICKFRLLGIRRMSAKVSEVATAMRIVAEENKSQSEYSNAQILDLCGV